MCSRFDQNIDVFGSNSLGYDAYSSPPIFNIGIGDAAWIIPNTAGKTVAVQAIWGMPNPWGAGLFYNARSEGDLNREDVPQYSGECGIFSKPAFRKLIVKNRCVIPVSAFYEGPKELGLKQPSRFESIEDPCFYLAGIWQETPNGKRSMAFCVITTAAIPPTASIGHHRAPMMLTADMVEDWLDENATAEELEAMMLNCWYPLDLSPTPIQPSEMKKRNSAVPLAVRTL